MTRARSAEGPTISLFPFLAVLLCTMGALLVLLVLFSRSAKTSGGQPEVDVSELEQARDELAWRLEQLAGVRDRTAEDLARGRLQLAGIEENSRELADELEQLGHTLKDLEEGSKRPQGDAELAALEAKLKSSKESLDKARAELATKPAAYAVVPYVGVNGTHRRPLYIECSIDGVYLQPEGVRLNPSDFEGPPGPGNPLACALRAAREHIARSANASGDPAAQPYPLLLVRPSGVMAYYAAREAIQSWGSEFGYQLVDEDWTLTFPPRDPSLAEVEKRAIEESRQRLQWLAEVRPARPAKPVRQYRAATTRGGVVANDGPSVLGDQTRFNWTNQQAEAAGAGGTGDGVGDGAGMGDRPGPGGRAAGGGGGPGRPLLAGSSDQSEGDADGTGGGDAILGRNPSAQAGSRFGGAGGGSAGVRAGSAGGVPGGPAENGVAGPPESAAGRYGNGSKFAGGSSANAGSGGTAGGSEVAGGAATGSATGSAAGAASAAGSGAAGGAAGASAGATAAAGGAAGGGASSSMAMSAGAPPMPGLMQSGGSGSGESSSSSSGASGSVAQSRGKNWASLATQDRPIPLSRPIQVECALDEFRILDDAGRRVQTRIPLDGDTGAAIDPLVKAIHARVAGWGIAGERMYWKPQLVLSATADGQSRRDDLERLLADSGLDTRHNGRDDEIRNLPPVQRTSYLSTTPRSAKP